MIEHGQFLVEALKKIGGKHIHISTKLECSWGTEACHEFFRSILTLDRNSRTGFDPSIYTILLLLYAVHCNQYGTFDGPVLLERLNIDLDSFN